MQIFNCDTAILLNFILQLANLLYMHYIHIDSYNYIPVVYVDRNCLLTSLPGPCMAGSCLATPLYFGV